MRATVDRTCYNGNMTDSKYNRYKHTTFQTQVFDKFVETKNGCHEFTGALNTNGYGRINFKNKKIYIHRAVYEHFNGSIPKGMVVRHKCNNPKCGNIDHLELGTHADNVQDKVNAGRQLKGTKIVQSKLTEEKVLKIRKLYAKGMSQYKLAKMYGVNPSSISYVVNKKTWGWL